MLDYAHCKQCCNCFYVTSLASFHCCVLVLFITLSLAIVNLLLVRVSDGGCALVWPRHPFFSFLVAHWLNGSGYSYGESFSLCLFYMLWVFFNCFKEMVFTVYPTGDSTSVLLRC